MRSAKSVQELIDTETKFYSYIDTSRQSYEHIPIIPDNLIIKKVDLAFSVSLQVPINFDKDLVYFVFCQYADNFIESSRNLLDGQAMFDKIVLKETYQRFMVRKGFFFVDEFTTLINNLQESGTYKFWYKQANEKSLGKLQAVEHTKESAFDVISFSGMAIPLIVLLVGCFVSFMFFIFENIVNRLKESCLNRIVLMRNRVKGLKIKRSVNLDKWLQKYVYKNKFKADETIKARKDEILRVPSPSASAGQIPTSLRRSSARALATESMIPPRQGSFRQQRLSPVQPASPAPIDKPALAFCKRRMSWPEINTTSTSRVQESDGSFFESFTALSWKRENRRMSAVRAAETRAEQMPIDEKETIKEDEIETVNEREQLYVDVLYTIANCVGCQQPGGQYAHYKDEMYIAAQRAFGVSPDRHYRLLHAAVEDKPKIIVLSVIVQEAEGLEAKDANGKFFWK
ncbi:unnamed protein product [Chironomus riparius]|uniref:Uncharacterized protein n=1 Tax=Chironomus riparius TaxID=315576 RepID=A0A9N9WU96_9DIPT|nr:unnamed protein product [Chironomus riparius]